MVKSFQNYFGLNEDASADLVALNQQEAAALAAAQAPTA